MKKNFKLSIYIIILLVIIPTDINATSGALRKNSIKTCPNGIKYGYHSDGKGGTHWHKAESHPKMSSGWAAVGDPILNDPCPKNSQSKPNQNNNTSNQNQTKPTTPPVVTKSNETGISLLIINNKKFYSVTDTIDHTIKTDKFEISVETKDKKATYQIIGLETKPEKNTITKYEILVTAEDDTKKTYVLNIFREIVDSYVRIKHLKINGNTINFNYNNDTKEITLSNDEETLNIEYELTNDNSNLLIIKNGIEVKNGSEIEIGKNNYQLKIIDDDGNEYSYNLVIERTSAVDDAIGSILGLATLAGGGYVAYRITNKKKNSN